MFTKFQLFVIIILIFSSVVYGIILGQDIKKEKIIIKTQIITQTEIIVKEVQSATLPENCIKGKSLFYNPELDSYIGIGETEICGFDIHTTNIVGPNYEEVINNLENDLSRWKDCALFKSCTPEMLAEKK